MAYRPDFIPGTTVGLPELAPSIVSKAFDGGTPIEHERFSLVFNEERGFAVYTAHNIDGGTVIPEGEIRRKDQFRYDPGVPAKLQVEDDRGYKGTHNPWDRGHLVRRRSLHWGDLDQARTGDSESFFWTNIAPQHRRLHSSAWGKIEDWMFERADVQDKRACVFTGPVYTSDDVEITNKPGEEPIQIPAGYWKIFVMRLGGHLRAATFLVWQRDFDRPEPLDFDPILEQVRLTTVEYLTGLSFAHIRDADPLHFGAARVRAFALARARAPVRSAAVLSAEDILL